jgi:hypothetical protein
MVVPLNKFFVYVHHSGRTILYVGSGTIHRAFLKCNRQKEQDFDKEK